MMMRLLKSRNKRQTQMLPLIFLWLWLLLILPGCNANGVQVTVTPTLSSSPTAPIFVPQPTRIPPGTEDNPLTIGYIDTLNALAVQSAGAEMIAYLEAETGYAIEYKVFDDAREAFSELRAQEIDFIWLQPLTYLAAYDRDLITPLFVSNHFGLYKYGTQFIANKSSGFVQYFDPATNKNTTTEEFALQQFEGQRPCLTEPSSLSGTIIPYGLLSRNGIQIEPPAYTQNHAATVRALYIKGICDFGTVFAYSGDPRTSSAVISDLSDAREQIITIWRSDPVIPSLSFHASTSLPVEITESVAGAMLKLAESENGNSILTAALDYDFQGMITIDNDYFAQLRDLVMAANVIPFQHLGY